MMRPIVNESRRFVDGANTTTPRGVILLECILSLALLVATGLAVIALIDRAGSAIERAKETEMAADLARSGMSKLEAGLETVQTLAGPVEAWRDEGDETFDDSLPEATPWSLAVEVEPAEFPGLTLVTVTAERSDTSGRVLTTYSLRQYVRLNAEQGTESGGAP